MIVVIGGGLGGGIRVIGELPSQISGIYLIQNTITRKGYVGSAVNVYERLYNHVWHLTRGSHKNGKLLASWRKHGADAFLAQLLEAVAEKNDLVAREQFWIDTLDAAVRGYNLNATAGNDLGSTRTPEVRRKLSAAARLQFSTEESRRQHSLVTRAGMDRTEVREKCRQAIQRRLSDKEARTKMARILYAPEMTARRTATLKKTIAAMTPEQKAVYATRGAATYLKMTPEQRASLRAAQVLTAAKNYRVTGPDGHVQTVFNLTQFCRQQGMNYRVALYSVERGIPTVTGYRFERLVQA